MALTPDALRQAMSRFATGVTVILTEHEGRVYGMTANAVTSVSLEPPLLLVCVGTKRYMHDVLAAAGAFTVNVLSEDQEAISRYYAGQRDLMSEEEIPLERGRARNPVLAGALAWLDCVITATHPGGDHTIFVARIEEAAWSEGRPLLFFRSRYRRLEDETAPA